jgi:hypothetical protein
MMTAEALRERVFAGVAIKFESPGSSPGFPFAQCKWGRARRYHSADHYLDHADPGARERNMKFIITAAALTCALAGPAGAGGGNIAGTESAGIPLNNSVYAPAIDPQTGKMPGYYGYGYTDSRPKPKVYKKKKRSHSTVNSPGY